MEQTEIINNVWGWSNILRAVILAVAGFILAKVSHKAVGYVLKERLSHHALILVQRATFWVILSLFLVSVIHQLGFRISVLLGAAGILTVAIGFASQTSASNLIAGLFVLGERSFSLGDVIRVGDTIGEVLSVDLLSVKLRTFDNLYVRIPNETIIKSEVTTLTKFPIRRFDMLIGIAYRSDIAKAKAILFKVAEDTLLCLEDPKPMVILKGFGNSSVDIQFSVWASRENFLALKNTMHEQVKNAFDEAGIEIPFPHVSLYTGAASEPFPITLVDANSASNPSR